MRERERERERVCVCVCVWMSGVWGCVDMCGFSYRCPIHPCTYPYKHETIHNSPACTHAPLAALEGRLLLGRFLQRAQEEVTLGDAAEAWGHRRLVRVVWVGRCVLKGGGVVVGGLTRFITRLHACMRVCTHANLSKTQWHHAPRCQSNAPTPPTPTYTHVHISTHTRLEISYPDGDPVEPGLPVLELRLALQPLHELLPVVPIVVTSCVCAWKCVS
jgi:hypothetical protein